MRPAEAPEVASEVDAVARLLVGEDPARRHEAMDLLTHALEHFGKPTALQTWRLALHERQVSADAREALAALFSFVEQHRADPQRIADICNCLVPTADHPETGSMPPALPG